MIVRNMTIAKRLGLGFGLVSLLLTVVIALGLVSLRQIQARMDEMIKINGVETKMAQAMDLTVTERALALRNLILLKEEKEIQVEIKRIAEQTKKYAAAQDNLGKLFQSHPSTSDEERQLLEQIKKQAELAGPFIERAAALAMAQQHPVRGGRSARRRKKRRSARR